MVTCISFQPFRTGLLTDKLPSVVNVQVVSRPGNDGTNDLNIPTSRNRGAFTFEDFLLRETETGTMLEPRDSDVSTDIEAVKVSKDRDHSCLEIREGRDSRTVSGNRKLMYQTISRFGGQLVNVCVFRQYDTEKITLVGRSCQGYDRGKGSVLMISPRIVFVNAYLIHIGCPPPSSHQTMVRPVFDSLLL